MNASAVQSALLSTRNRIANDPSIDPRVRMVLATLSLCLLAKIAYSVLNDLKAQSGWLAGRGIAAVHGWLSDYMRKNNCAAERQ